LRIFGNVDLTLSRAENLYLISLAECGIFSPHKILWEFQTNGIIPVCYDRGATFEHRVHYIGIKYKEN
jgi:hypothetical protein